MKIRFLSLSAALLACLFAAFSARAELLLYDGFATATDSQSRTPYLNTSDTHKLQSNNAKGAAWTTGLSSSYPWSESSGTVFTFRSNGLSLPAAFANAAGDQFAARGGSAGYQSGNDPDSEYRAKNRAITSTMPTSGTLYYRCVMLMEQNAYNKFKTGTHFAGTGLSTHAAENKYDNGGTLASNGFRLYFQGNSTGGQHVQLRLSVGSGPSYATLVESIDYNIAYICIVGIDYGTGKACAYAAKVSEYNEHFTWTATDLDASTITGSAIKTMYLDGAYKTNNGRVRFDEIAAGTKLTDVAVWSSASAPALKNGTLSLANGTYTATALLTNSAATVSYVLSDGATATTNSIAAYSDGDTASTTFAAPTDNKTYEVLLVAENQGGETGELSLGTIYGGTVALAKVSDGSELGLTPATLTVSRTSDDPFPLVVNYAFADGTAVAGVNYVDDAGSVTIPAGEASATIRVTPLVDVATDADTAMTVSITAGNYTASAAAVSVAIANFTTPAGQNYWVGGTATYGVFLASTPANWSAGHAPLDSETVIFDGNFSNTDCTWDSAAPRTVAGWTQNANYTGIVEIQTTYASNAFPLLSVTGDCAVNGGIWTHTSNTNVSNGAESAQYRLNVAVGGDFTLGAGASINLIGRGFAVGRRQNGSQVGVHAATAQGNYSFVYGNVYAPENVGTGGESGKSNTSAGGGAVKLAVTGTAVIDGTITANACSQTLLGGNPEKGYGSGGSVFITAGAISGSGTLDVSARPSGSTDTSYTSYAGSGGRMALVATSGSVTIPMANLLANGSLGAHSAGAGTIFMKNSTDLNGSLLVGNSVIGWNFTVRYPRKDSCTCVKPGETWTFDHIYFRDSGILSVPTNATLSLPGGFESVSSLTDSSTPFCGILYLGGTIALPAREEHVLSSGWMFMAAEPFTINGDVRLSSHASIGSFQLYADSVAAYPACTVTVTGDMTVESEASLYAKSRGRRGSDESPDTGYHGGSVASGTRHLLVYDSILYPTLGGTGGRSKGDMGNTNPGGGAIVLTVGGALTLNGNADAGTSAVSGNHHRGGAGTINITAGTIAGAGSIAANGANGTSGSARGAGGGGRVAVRLTDAGATFANFSGSITAEGNNANSKSLDYGSSAGTVYLQDGNTANGAGTIKVANISNSTAEDAKTGFPSLSNGEPIDDLTKANLEISNNSTVILIADVKMSGLEIASGSKLDLNGKTFTVKSAKVNGVKLAPGTYTADNAAVAGFVVDSTSSGTLVVTGGGFSIIVR